jgi:hypothetical protein
VALYEIATAVEEIEERLARLEGKDVSGDQPPGQFVQ